MSFNLNTLFYASLPAMGFHKSSCDAKVAAIRLYEHLWVDLDDILECCGFSEGTWYRILKLYRETGGGVSHKVSLRGHLRLLQ